MEESLKRLTSMYQDSCAEEISELVYQINKMLSERKLEWDSSYNKLLVSHEMLAKSLRQCKEEQADKNAEIRDLQNEIAVVNKANYEKRILLESQISTLKERSDLNIKCFSESPTHKLRIKSLEKERGYYEDKLAELEIVQTTNSTQIKLLEEQRSDILKKNEELKQNFASSRKEYHKKIEASKKEMTSILLQKEKSHATIGELKLTIKQKDAEIITIKGTLEDLLSSNHKNNSVFSNMQKKMNELDSEKVLFSKQVEKLEIEKIKLTNKCSQLDKALSEAERGAKCDSTCSKAEMNALHSQLEIHTKENEFLRQLLLQQDKGSQAPAGQLINLERLETDNNSLRQNIQNMEREIANLISLTEKSQRLATSYSPPGISSEVLKVKERYETHLTGMKAEVEQLRLENLSLKAIHSNCEQHSFANTSFASNYMAEQTANVEEIDLNIDDQKTQNSLQKSPRLSSQSEISLDIGSPVSASKKDKECEFTKEFEELQKNVLSQFEKRLNKCINNFTSDDQLSI